MSRKRKERKEKRKERKFMGKLISLTPEVKDHLRSEFEKYLDSAKCQDGKVQFIRQLDSVKDRKATVYLTPQAFAKMWALISNFNKEVAWHGLARRMEDETKDEYLIYDILVYPQEVTGTTVNTDQMEYQNWLLGLPNEVFNNVRFQGHSHVDMAVNPSGTDLDHQRRLLDQLGPEDFYIFQIWNKRSACHTKIYDMKKNIFFDNADCTVRMFGDGVNFEEFLNAAKGMVKDRSYSTPSYANGYHGGSGVYSSDTFGGRGGNTTVYGTPAVTPLPSAGPVVVSKETAKAPDKKPNEAPAKPRVPIAGNYILDDEDDDVDPFPET